MSDSGSSLNSQLSRRTSLFSLKVWVVIAITIGLFSIIILSILAICVTVKNKRKVKRAHTNLPIVQIPVVSKEIKEVRVDQTPASAPSAQNGTHISHRDHSGENEWGKMKKTGDHLPSGSLHFDRDCNSQSGDEGSFDKVRVRNPTPPSHPLTAPSPLVGLPELSSLGWGYWFTLRDLEVATNRFSKDNILGEGGYGIVYRGCLINGAAIAVKKLLNNL